MSLTLFDVLASVSRSALATDSTDGKKERRTRARPLPPQLWHWLPRRWRRRTAESACAFFAKKPVEADEQGAMVRGSDECLPWDPLKLYESVLDAVELLNIR